MIWATPGLPAPAWVSLGHCTVDPASMVHDVGAAAFRYLVKFSVVPDEEVSTEAARAVMPEQAPLADAVFNVAHAALLTLGLVRGDWDTLARGLADRLHQQQRGELFPRSLRLAQRARELGALGATISGAGPTVLVWTHYEQTGGVLEGLRRAAGEDVAVMRVPFEPQGADVRKIT